MAIELVTGFAGRPHVHSDDLAKLNAALVGPGNYLMTGLGDNELNAYMATSNRLHAGSGIIIAQGRQIAVDADGADWTVQNGTQGQSRIDVACIKYSKNPSTGIETVEPVVVKGTPAAANPAAPSVPACDLMSGDAAEGLVPVFRIALSGTVPGQPALLLERASPLATALAGYLLKTGGTITGPLILSRAVDASGKADNRPALVVGGMPTAPHLEFDGNEVMAKADATTPADLTINGDGGDVAFGGAVKPKTPVAVANGGTAATTAEQARKNLGITLASLDAAASSHKHSAADVNGGTVAVEFGGTGATTAASARKNLGITPANIEAASAAHNHSASNITSGTLPVARGGTGASTSGGLGLHAYPVGAVYISFVSTSPASLFGGSWTAITGRFPYFNASTATGGGGTHTHALSAAGGACIDTELNATYHLALFGRKNGTPTFAPSTKYSVQGSAHNTSLGETLNNTAALTGKTDAVAANLPPYQSFYAWRRTA